LGVGKETESSYPSVETNEDENDSEWGETAERFSSNKKPQTKKKTPQKRKNLAKGKRETWERMFTMWSAFSGVWRGLRKRGEDEGRTSQMVWN